MHLYHCTLTFHDNLFYETRTLGRLYETGRLLHNIALCYALGFAQTDYYHHLNIPSYDLELNRLNLSNIYVTPANGDDIQYVINTFKYGDERSFVFEGQATHNIPTFGRAKEVAVGSRFTFGVLSPDPLTFPRWIRMGLWMSKARLVVDEPVTLTRRDGRAEHTISAYPMNPGDLPDGASLKLFDLVSMRPSSLVENALIEADGWWTGRLNDKTIYLPADLLHRAAVAGKK